MATVTSIHKSLLLALAVTFSLRTTSAQVAETPTAYEMLEKYNFPQGILPQGVKSYVLNQDGSFQVLFSSDCEFEVSGGYLLKYKRKISGKVVDGALKDLKGISVKVLFVWFNINSVVRNDADLSFYVGPLSAAFPVSNFDECPQCGCGFDCSTNALSADS